MLHVLNGEALQPAWQAAGLTGTAFIWREILMEGPLAPDLSSGGLPERRAAYLEARLGVPEATFRAGLEAQAAALAACREAEEVVLWFDADLFCQVHLAWLGARFAAPDLMALPLSAVYEPLDPDGEPTAEGMRQRFAARRPVEAAERQAAADLWRALASPDPAGLLAWRGAPAPFFGADLVGSHLERFPAEENGLSRVEEAILSALVPGPLDVASLFRRAGRGPAARRQGLGDLQFFAIVGDLAAGRDPAVELDPPGRLPRYGQDPAAARAITASISRAGRNVLAGRRDRFAGGGPEIWLGGYRLPPDGGRLRRRASPAGPDLVQG